MPARLLHVGRRQSQFTVALGWSAPLQSRPTVPLADCAAISRGGDDDGDGGDGDTGDDGDDDGTTIDDDDDGGDADTGGDGDAPRPSHSGRLRIPAKPAPRRPLPPPAAKRAHSEWDPAAPHRIVLPEPRSRSGPLWSRPAPRRAMPVRRLRQPSRRSYCPCTSPRGSCDMEAHVSAHASPRALNSILWPLFLSRPFTPRIRMHHHE